jgi:hypothetical protein
MDTTVVISDVLANSNGSECFVNGECINSVHLESLRADDEVQPELFAPLQFVLKLLP